MAAKHGQFYKILTMKVGILDKWIDISALVPSYFQNGDQTSYSVWFIIAEPMGLFFRVTSLTTKEVLFR